MHERNWALLHFRSTLRVKVGLRLALSRVSSRWIINNKRGRGARTCNSAGNCLCIVFTITTKRKHNKVTLKTNHEALKKFDKSRHKEAAIQFNVPRSTLSTWNQPVSTIVCSLLFLNFLSNLQSKLQTRMMKMKMKNLMNKLHILEVMKLTRQSKLWLFPMHPFFTPWKHQKTVKFSDVFRA